MSIHEKLRQLRLSKNLSQANIAFMLNISQNAYSLIESGKTKIDEQRIIQFGKILGVRPSELLTDEIPDPILTAAKEAYDNNSNLIDLLSEQILKKDEQIAKLLAHIEYLSSGAKEL